MADDIVYKVSLDDKDVITALKNIDKNVEKLAKDARQEFDGIGKGAKLSGANIGAMSGIVSSLTTEFINLGKQAIASLIDISKQAVNVASGYETLEARLLGIFSGNQDAADESFRFIQQRSRELGIALSELAGAFLPQVENLDQFERVAKIATALARSDPEQGAIGARIALIEALSGTFISLQRRFEIPKAEIDRLKEAFDTEGIEGFLSTLEKILAESGKSFDDLADTAVATFDRARIQGQQLLGVLGQPILEELKQQFEDIGAIVAERSDDFELIATAIGQLVANVVNFVGTNFADFLQNLDRDQILGIVEDFNGIVESARSLSEILGLTKLPQELLDGIAQFADDLNTALITAVQLSGLAKAAIARRQAEEAVRAEQGLTALGGFVTFPGTEEQQAEQIAAGQEAFNQVIYETLDILAESKDRQDDYNTSLEEFTQAQEDARGAGTGLADVLLAQRQAAKEAAEGLSEDVQKALDKLNDLERDAARDRIDIIRKAGQKQIDAEEEAIQKRIDQARKFLQELEDIERKNSQAITDSATDLRRDEEDAQRDYSRKRIDIEKDQAKKAIEIEEDYQQEIRDIQDRFNIDSDEAARNRDAVTFLRLQRQRDRELEEARQTRDEKLADNVQEGEEKRQQLKQELEYELEDARIADERRLEDLKIRLEREIEEAKLKNQRELDELAINEERKQAELKTSLDRQLEESRIANDRRVQDYKDSLDEEVAALLEAEEAKTEILKEQIKKRNELDRQLEEEKSQENSRLGGRQFGGPVGSGQSVVVGERGPEIFVPSVAGDIVPLQPGITSPLAARNITSTINNIQNASVNQSFGANQDAISAQIARNAALETIRQILAR